MLDNGHISTRTGWNMKGPPAAETRPSAAYESMQLNIGRELGNFRLPNQKMRYNLR